MKAVRITALCLRHYLGRPAAGSETIHFLPCPLPFDCGPGGKPQLYKHAGDALMEEN